MRLHPPNNRCCDNPDSIFRPIEKSFLLHFAQRGRIDKLRGASAAQLSHRRLHIANIEIEGRFQRKHGAWLGREIIVRVVKFIDQHGVVLFHIAADSAMKDLLVLTADAHRLAKGAKHRFD